MIQLLDGPAEGTYMVRRAPLYLRAVIDASLGEKDVLDQLTDVPKATEIVHVSKRVGGTMSVHLNFGAGRKARGRTGFYATGEYKHIPGIDGEPLRHQAAWEQWCRHREGDKS